MGADLHYLKREKAVLDTCVYISFMNQGLHAGRMSNLVQTTFLFLHSIVLEELLAGCRGKKEIKKILELKNMLEPTGRIITPTHSDWEETGRIVNKLLQKGRNPVSLTHDVLLTVSCRRMGVRVVTENQKDFEQIRRIKDFKLTVWPQA
ncbi:MAG TPA: hypothetical protein DDW49_10595 [Deltaproteobacteria bacterium]|nr:hypothetical protein [Deltaproteobacteria bacterium]